MTSSSPTDLWLAPLSVAEVHAMLDARYAHLRLDPNRPVATPVEPDAVALLHEFYRWGPARLTQGS